MTFIKQPTSEPYDYVVCMDKPCTVKEFIASIIGKFPEDFGFIGIASSRIPLNLCSCLCEYSKGVSVSSIPDKYAGLEVHDAIAYGSKGNFDYVLIVKSITN